MIIERELQLFELDEVECPQTDPREGDTTKEEDRVPCGTFFAILTSTDEERNKDGQETSDLKPDTSVGLQGSVQLVDSPDRPSSGSLQTNTLLEHWHYDCSQESCQNAQALHISSAIVSCSPSWRR